MKNRNNQPTRKTNTFVYSHYGESDYLKQRYYEIVDYPEWWNFSKTLRKKIAGKAMLISTNEVQSNVEDKSQPTTNVTHLGIFGKVNVFSALSKNDIWIIDTGALNHMIEDSDQLPYICPSS